MSKLKEGMSVKELETLAKRHRCAVFFCLAFVFACFFSFVFFGVGWAIIFTSAGGIIGVLIPTKIETFMTRIFQFVFKQEKTVQLILGIVGLIFAIFLPPLVFLTVGMNGGKSLHIQASRFGGQ